MADNVVVSAGTGTTVAADEVVDGTLGTVKVQFVKLMDGTLDGSTKATVGAGGLKVDPTSSVAVNTGARSATTQRVTVATDDLVPVGGDVASGSTDSGNPVKGGGVFITTPTAITTGQRGAFQLDANSNLRVVATSTATTGADGIANASIAQTLNRSTGTTAVFLNPTASYVFNGTTFDRPRSVAGDAQAATGIAAVGPMVWNGSTYDRMPGSTAGLVVASHAVTLAAGAAAIAKAEDVASADADVGVPSLAVRKATPANTSGTDGDYEFLQMSAGRLWASADVTLAGTAAAAGSGATSSATLRTVLATDSPGIITVGTAGTPSANVVTTQGVASMTPLLVTPGVSATANGATASRINATASNNLTSVKASTGQLYSIDVFNVAAYNVFLKLYNKASAPVVASDTPIMTIPIQAGGGYSKTWPMGKSFSTGIAYAIVKLQADTDATNVVAGDLTGSIDWI